jgi:RNA polymerase sigma-70 factor (ECF subfamily)
VTSEFAAIEESVRTACNAGEWSSATTLAIEGYGDEVLAYLAAMTRSELVAGDAFSITCEELWKSLPKFRWDCSLRTWTYGLARVALGRIHRDPYRKRAVGISDAGISKLAAAVRTRTATFLRTESKDAIAALRAELDPDDQTLLILRVNRGLSWTEIARVLAEDEEASAESLKRSAAALRKRFERLKSELKEKASKLDPAG